MNVLFKALSTAPREQTADWATFKLHFHSYCDYVIKVQDNPPTTPEYCQVSGLLLAIATQRWSAPYLYHLFSTEEKELATRWLGVCDVKIRELHSKGNTCAKQLAILKNIRP